MDLFPAVPRSTESAVLEAGRRNGEPGAHEDLDMFTTRRMVLSAMVLFTIASMVTTYISLSQSVLPEPTISIPIPGQQGQTWDCAWLSLFLSVGIGLMLFALKIAIIDEQKRLNLFGVIGLVVVGFISISFNMDVLYRFANRDFFIMYSRDQVKTSYASYLSQVETELTRRKEDILKKVGRQEGELEAETKGLREAPEGYGPRAKKEDYYLTVLKKETEVELKTIEEARTAKAKADELLVTATPRTLPEISDLQDQLQVACKDVGAKVGIPLPEPVQLRNPLFAVFDRLFDWQTVGVMEIFIMALAFLLDLSDILGYSLVPDKKEPRPKRTSLVAVPSLSGPEIIPDPDDELLALEDSSAPDMLEDGMFDEGERVRAAGQRGGRRPFRFRK